MEVERLPGSWGAGTGGEAVLGRCGKIWGNLYSLVWSGGTCEGQCTMAVPLGHGTAPQHGEGQQILVCVVAEAMGV